MNVIFKIINSFKANGFIDTISKIVDKVLKMLGIRVSETYFFQMDLNDAILQNNNNMKPYKTEYLDYDKKTQFENMKYFNFLDVDGLLTFGKSNVLIALDENKIIGYVCMHRGTKHLIHNLGYWNLDDNEAWIGPIYVIKGYRNKGFSKFLLKNAVNELHKLGIVTFYTAVNKNNISSIRSFSNVMFNIIGMVETRNILNVKCKINIVDYSPCKNILTKFSDIKD